MKNKPYSFVSEEEEDSYYIAIAIVMIFASGMMLAAML